MAKIDQETAIAQAKLILEKRRQKRYDDFHPTKEGGAWRYCQYFDPEFFTDAKEHVLKPIADAVQDVIMGDIKYMMLNMPPRTGKSYTVSVLCSYGLGYFPDDSIMRACASDKLSIPQSKDVRGFVDSKKFRGVFKGIRLNKNNKSSSEWSLNERTRANYSATTVGGTSLGKGFSLFGIIDDHLKGPKECTPDNLSSQWKWYLAVMRSRRENTPRLGGRKAGVIIIATRWHKQDISGMILSIPQNLKTWKVVKQKALLPNHIDKNAKSFCEEIHSTEDLLEEVRDMRATGEIGLFLSEYQQEPIDEEGQLYSESKLTMFSKKEMEGREKLHTTFHIDFADDGDDFLAMPIVVEMGKIDGSQGTDKYFVDCVFDQSDVTITMPKIIEKVKMWRPDRINVETNSGGKMFMRDLKKEIDKLNLGYDITITGQYQSKNKETKILASVGNVITNIKFLLDSERDAEYNAFMLNLTTYSKSGRNKHDDAPDSLSDMIKLIKGRNVYIGLIG
jgi:predicted phage terminase large subunit-like protein